MNRLLKSLQRDILHNGYPFLVVFGIEVIFVLYLFIHQRGVTKRHAYQYLAGTVHDLPQEIYVRPGYEPANLLIIESPGPTFPSQCGFESSTPSG